MFGLFIKSAHIFLLGELWSADLYACNSVASGLPLAVCLIRMFDGWVMGCALPYITRASI